MSTTVEKQESSGLRSRLPEGFRIKLIGLGGIGCVVLPYLTMFLDNLGIPGRLVLIDGDEFETKNSERMQFQDIGNKADIKAQEAVSWIERGALTVASVPEFVTPENLERLIRPHDIVMMGVDNYQTRRKVSEYCETLSDIVLFSGGNDGVEPPHQQGTYGNVQIAIRAGNRELTAPLTRFHPEIATADGPLPDDPSCGVLVTSVPQILFTNLAVASAMLNAFFAYTCGKLHYQEVKFDILEGRSLPQLPIKPEVTRQFPLGTAQEEPINRRHPK